MFDVPTSAKEWFKPYSKFGLTWPAFLMLRESERKRFHRKVQASPAIQDTLNHAIAEDMRKLNITRPEVEEEISRSLKRLEKLPVAELYVGIQNQRNTCYLNALLQSLFNVTYFRNLIYQVQAPQSTPEDSIPLALQRLFFNLETKQPKVTTLELTKAFGWDTTEAAVQHDIHELTRKLLDELGTEFEQTAHADAVKKMMGGKLNRAIHCLDVDYVSRREETFFDLELTVKGNPSLMDSMRSLCCTERFDFKYTREHPDGTKTQHDAEQRTSFKYLPPILICHPTRLDFDPYTAQRTTVPDRWTFEPSIDLTPFLEEHEGMGSPQPSEEWKRESSICADNSAVFNLNSVIIHSGGAGAGHYYAIVKHDSRWIKLNDDLVSEVTWEEVCSVAFAGTYTTTDYWGRRVERPSPTRCALLIYINAALEDKIVFDIDVNELPPYLHAGLESQRLQAEAEKQTALKESKLIGFECIGVSNDPNYMQDFGSRDRRTTVKAPNDGTCADLLVACAEKFNPAQSSNTNIRVWAYNSYFAYEYYHQPLYAARPLKVEDKISSIAGQSTYDRRLLFVVCKDTPAPEGDPFLLHVMHLSNQDLSFIGATETMQEFQSTVQELFQSDEPALFYLQNDRCVLVANASSFVSGDRVVIAPPGTLAEHVSKALDRLYRGLDVTVLSMTSNGTPKELMTLRLTEGSSYAETQESIFNALKDVADFPMPPSPQHIGLRKHDVNADQPSRYLSSTHSGRYPVTLKELLGSGSFGFVPKLYISTLPAPIDIVLRQYLECIYSVGDQIQQEMFVCLDHIQTYADLFAEAAKAVPQRAGRKLRAIETYQVNRTDEEHDDPTEPTPRNWKVNGVVFDELPETCEADVAEGVSSLRVDVVNLSKGTTDDFFGYPTSVWVNSSDTGATLLKKIIAKLAVPEADVANATQSWRLHFRTGADGVRRIRDADEAYPIVKRFAPHLAWSYFLLIERPQPNASQSGRRRQAEPELRIKRQQNKRE